MKSTFLIILTSLITISCIFSQNRISKEKIDLLKSNNIRLVDSASFFQDILKDNNKVKYIIIYDNFCSGTPGIFQHTIPKLISEFDKRLEIFLISTEGSSTRSIKDLILLLKKYNYSNNVTYFIDPNKYSESKMDTRKKGYKFRNIICKPCNQDVIGVPYNLIFDENNNYLDSGYFVQKDFIQILREHFETNLK